MVPQFPSSFRKWFVLTQDVQYVLEPEQVKQPAVTESHKIQVSVCKNVFDGHEDTQVDVAWLKYWGFDGVDMQDVQIWG